MGSSTYGLSGQVRMRGGAHFGAPFTRIVARQGAPPAAPVGKFECGAAPISAQPLRGSWSHGELHLWPQWARRQCVPPNETPPTPTPSVGTPACRPSPVFCTFLTRIVPHRQLHLPPQRERPRAGAVRLMPHGATTFDDAFAPCRGQEDSGGCLGSIGLQGASGRRCRVPRPFRHTPRADRAPWGGFTCGLIWESLHAVPRVGTPSCRSRPMGELSAPLRSRSAADWTAFESAMYDATVQRPDSSGQESSARIAAVPTSVAPSTRCSAFTSNVSM